MRKAKKKQAEDFIQLLGQAHVEIKKALETKKYEMARTLLEQCQDGAIELGNMIEEQEGEGFVTVSLLEEYCELVYQFHEGIWQKQISHSGKVYKSLKKQLIQIENSVKNDISVKIEAVFLPYKASMWDSLESVWQAADEDPDCDAYVIPIPYYDRNPDGSFGEMHDERKLYPAYVPVTDYEKFDFAAHCPDMIFIHNPYDECNYVTSVHPFFYSSNLKKYTEKLVYILYFILGDVDLESEEAIKGMAHFVTTPGVVNADKVVVQSENMRQAYVQAMVMVTGEHTRGYWEEKILGLGSPKIDKVLATRKEDVEVPKEWLKVIEKEDGSWKKIIFYNTSVSALLNHNEKMNAKIKNVLQVFKENQEVVALLWRPHPLIEATIKSVRPRLWEEYKEIVDTYKREGWGIYDDTADMDRAVVLSDAYYGDASSIVQLYQETGKPVMYQNVDIIETVKYSSYLPFDGGFYFDEKLWCINWQENALCTIDTNTGKVEYVDEFKYEEKGRTYLRIIGNKQYLYLLPGTSKYIVKYDVQNKSKKYIDYTRKNIWNAYYATIIYGDNIFAFPLHEKVIMKINILTDQISYLNLPDIDKNDEQLFNEKGYFTNRFVCLDKNIIIPCAFTNQILIFDLEKEICKWKYFSQNCCGFKDIIYLKENIFLLDQNMNIFKCENIFQEISNKKICLKEKIYYMIGVDRGILLIPNGTSPILKIDENGLYVSKYKYPKNHKFYEAAVLNNSVIYSDIVENNDKAYLIPRFSNMLVLIDKMTGNIDFKIWKLGRNMQNHEISRMKQNIKKDSSVFEGDCFFDDYLIYVQQHDLDELEWDIKDKKNFYKKLKMSN